MTVDCLLELVKEVIVRRSCVECRCQFSTNEDVDVCSWCRTGEPSRPPRPTCVCGCGGDIAWRGTPLNGQWQKFVHGHHARGKGNPNYGGKIKRTSRPPEERFWEKVQKKRRGCWEWLGGKIPDGYGSFRINKDTVTLAHRYMWELKIELIPEGMQILHHCDNPGCVRLDHLFLGTNAMNMEDKCKKGRQTRGEAHPQAKLDEDDIFDIFFLYGKRKWTPSDLAEAYEIDRSQVSDILNRKKWKHIVIPKNLRRSVARRLAKRKVRYRGDLVV